MNRPQRKAALFDPRSRVPFKLSRYRIERFVKCQRCFWLELRAGVKPPEPKPYSINSAVDVLLKKEFDIYRALTSPHPLMTQYGIRGIPFRHEQLDIWREPFKGLEHHHQPTGLIISGAPDDIWLIDDRGLAIVDYKSTSSGREHPIDSDYWDDYKRQVEIYQWLLERQETGFMVSHRSYFVLANGRKDRERFNGRVEFSLEIITHDGQNAWVEPTICSAYSCLMNDELPPTNPKGCELCLYRRNAYRCEMK